MKLDHQMEVKSMKKDQKEAADFTFVFVWSHYNRVFKVALLIRWCAWH